MSATFFCSIVEFLAGCDADHLLDEIDTGDQFGHGMLDLQTGVHFQEVKTLVLAGDEFDGAGGVVVHRFCQRDRLLAHLAPRRFIEQRRRRFLDDLLVAALDRAFALAEINDVAMLVAEHLDFDVPGVDDEFFDEDAIVAERRLGFRARQLESLGDLGGAVGDAHALAATASGSLDHHGIADVARDLHRLLVVLDDAEMAGDGRDPCPRRGLLGFDLVAHRGDCAGVRPDEGEAGGGQRLRKCLALGEKSVAGMDGLSARALAGVDDLLDDEVAFGRLRRPDRHRIVRHGDVERVLVGVRINSDGLDPHFPRRLDHPAGDLTAVCDQDPFEHASPTRIGQLGHDEIGFALPLPTKPRACLGFALPVRKSGKPDLRWGGVRGGGRHES